MHAGLLLAGALAPLAAAQNATSYDYVIAGAGTAGMLLGVVLSENPKVNVLVLEAGADGRTEPNITVPENRGLIQDSKYDWAYSTVQQPGLYNNRSEPVPRGKTIGGTAAMNWMIFNEDSRVQLDIWQDTLNLTGWNWTTISTAFRENERFYAPPANSSDLLTYNLANHGCCGIINGTLQRSVLNIFSDVKAALLSAGYSSPQDRNGGDSVGFGPFPLAVTPDTYTRSYSGSAYTHVQSRPNLQVRPNSLVTRILWSGAVDDGLMTASGLEYIDLQSNRTQSVRASQVIVSSGVVGSPQILQLSGIGDPAILSPLGIKPMVNLTSVGVGLRDPPMMIYEPLTLNFTRAVTGGEYNQNFIDLEPASRMLEPADYAAANAWLNSTSHVPGLQDAQLQVFKELWYREQPIFEFAWQYSTAQVMPYNLVPLSQGTVHINSSDPRHPPAIDPRYNTVKASINGTQVDWDMWLLAKASQRYLKTLATHAPTNVTMNSTEPDWRLPFPQFYDQIYQRVGTSEHLTGGMPMGSQDIGGVVDTSLKVYGTSNVRIVDGSVFPYQPSAHPMGITYAIAVMAARILEQLPGRGGLTATELPASNSSANATASFGVNPGPTLTGAAMTAPTRYTGHADATSINWRTLSAAPLLAMLSLVF